MRFEGGVYFSESMKAFLERVSSAPLQKRVMCHVSSLRTGR